MTLQECQVAALRGEKVRHTVSGIGSTYDRIEFVGYKYQNGKQTPCVRLVDKCGHSVTDAHPMDLEPEEAAKVAEIANYAGGKNNDA